MTDVQYVLASKTLFGSEGSVRITYCRHHYLLGLTMNPLGLEWPSFVQSLCRHIGG